MKKSSTQNALTSLAFWINNSYLSPNITTILQKKFRAAKPYPHLQLPNFLKKEVANKLLKELKKEKFDLKESDLFTFFQTSDLVTTNNLFIKEFRSFLCSAEFILLMTRITNLQLKKNSIDLAGTLYTNTNHLLPHDDQLENRKIAFMFYLTSLKKEDGGALGLYTSKNNAPTKITRKYSTQFNTFFFFQVSPVSFHEVEEVLTDTQRITLSGWFHDQ